MSTVFTVHADPTLNPCYVARKKMIYLFLTLLIYLFLTLLIYLFLTLLIYLFRTLARWSYTKPMLCWTLYFCTKKLINLFRTWCFTVTNHQHQHIYNSYPRENEADLPWALFEGTGTACIGHSRGNKSWKVMILLRLQCLSTLNSVVHVRVRPVLQTVMVMTTTVHLQAPLQFLRLLMPTCKKSVWIKSKTIRKRCSQWSNTE